MRLCDGLVGDLAGEHVDAPRERGIVGDRVAEPLVGDRLDVRERHVRQRLRRGDRHRAGHVGDAVVDDPVDLEDRARHGSSRVRSRSSRPGRSPRRPAPLRASSAPSISRVTSFGASAPGTSTAPITMSASRSTSSICRRFDIASVTRPSSVDLEIAHPLDRPVEHPDVGLHADSDQRSVVARRLRRRARRPSPAGRPERRRGGCRGRRVPSRATRRPSAARVGLLPRSSVRAAGDGGRRSRPSRRPPRRCPSRRAHASAARRPRCGGR